jgi:hypothetical protein
MRGVWRVSTKEVELEQAGRFEHRGREFAEVVVTKLQAPEVLEAAQVNVQFYEREHIEDH